MWCVVDKIFLTRDWVPVVIIPGPRQNLSGGCLLIRNLVTSHLNRSIFIQPSLCKILRGDDDDAPLPMAIVYEWLEQKMAKSTLTIREI